MDIDLSKSTIDFKAQTFSDHLGSTFTIDLDGSPLDLTLDSVDAIKATPKGPGVPETIREDPFALVFRGPVEQPLIQRLYAVNHADLGEFALFLVPIGMEENGRLFESVFN